MGRRNKYWHREKVRSGLEFRIREDLKRESGIRFGYEDRKYSYITEHKYTPDFTFYSQSGDFVFACEIKGRFTATDRNKLLAVRKANPELDLRIVFQRDQAIRKGSKTYYSDWAKKHGYCYHIGEEVPTEWLNQTRGE